MKPSVPVLSLLLLLSSASVSAFAPLPGLNLRPRSFAHQPRSTVSWSRTLALQAEKAEKDAGQDDDEAPPLSEDWRNFRARLVSQEAPPYAVTAEMWNPDPETEDEAVFSGASNFIDPRKRKRSSRVRDGAGESWAHEAPVEPGCILIARPDYFGKSQHYFNQAVICIVEHNEKGTAGFVLNRPTPYKIGSVTNKLPGFEECPLYMGGDVGEGVQVLHGVRSMAGSKEIVDGLMMGVDPWQAQELVESGEQRTQDFRFFYKYAGWAPGQLKEEVERGVWYSAACSRDLILRQCLHLPKPLWREVLELMGGRYSLISKSTYGEL